MTRTPTGDLQLKRKRTTRSNEKFNADGSIDVFIGAKAPAGFEKNHMKTISDDGWFVYFRLYAPLQPFFDKTFHSFAECGVLHSLWNAGTNQVARGRAAAIMKEPTRHTGRATCVRPSLAPDPYGHVIATKDERVVTFTFGTPTG